MLWVFQASTISVSFSSAKMGTHRFISEGMYRTFISIEILQTKSICFKFLPHLIRCGFLHILIVIRFISKEANYMENQRMNREKFSSGLAVFFATLGSAVGLGNIWKVPYLTGKFGGGA